jgi:hypothetical protein
MITSITPRNFTRRSMAIPRYGCRYGSIGEEAATSHTPAPVAGMQQALNFAVPRERWSSSRCRRAASIEQEDGRRSEAVDHAIECITDSRGKHRKGGLRPGAVPVDRNCTWCTTHSGNMASRWIWCAAAAEEKLSSQVSVIHVSIRYVMCIIYNKIDRLLTHIQWTSQYVSHVRIHYELPWR